MADSWAFRGFSQDQVEGLRRSDSLTYSLTSVVVGVKLIVDV